MKYCAVGVPGICTSHHTRRPGGCGVCHCGRASAGWGGCGRGGGDCHTGQGHKLLGIDGGGGCGIYSEQEEVVANR